MKHKTRYIPIILVIIYLGFSGCIIPHKIEPVVQSKHFGPSECAAAMKYIIQLWNQKNENCLDNRKIAAKQIEELVNKEHCFIGQHFREIVKYIGKPDFSGTGRQEYNISEKDRRTHRPTGDETLRFEIDKDSILTGLDINIPMKL